MMTSEAWHPRIPTHFKTAQMLGSSCFFVGCWSRVSVFGGGNVCVEGVVAQTLAFARSSHVWRCRCAHSLPLHALWMRPAHGLFGVDPRLFFVCGVEDGSCTAAHRCMQASDALLFIHYCTSHFTHTIHVLRCQRAYSLVFPRCAAHGLSLPLRVEYFSVSFTHTPHSPPAM
jgi:hypothetical protein